MNSWLWTIGSFVRTSSKRFDTAAGLAEGFMTVQNRRTSSRWMWCRQVKLRRQRRKQAQAKRLPRPPEGFPCGIDMTFMIPQSTMLTPADGDQDLYCSLEVLHHRGANERSP
jgi:hypothetical protein